MKTIVPSLYSDFTDEMKVFEICLSAVIRKSSVILQPQFQVDYFSK